ncbi:MAG TPA: phenylalanine--tRNA ligase beta subunit-related protein [Thermomicrobiales bacterium]|nr:phenylalanine--tRNA ligase beta subunit-related protein [Thermomicrobiales bacterium]
MHRLRVDPLIQEQFPDYVVLVIYASHLVNRESSEQSIGLLREAAQRQRAAFGAEKPATHAHIAAWRETFGRFGAKPSRYPCSVEALLSRALKGQELPAINEVVDIYNALSVRHVLPVGGENLDALTSDLTLTFADGTEPFDELAGGEAVVSFPEPGEAVWADSSGVTCRRWNSRQGFRTRLTEETRNAYFVLDRLAPYPLETLRQVGDELVALLRERSPEAEFEMETIGPLKE